MHTSETQCVCKHLQSPYFIADWWQRKQAREHASRQTFKRHFAEWSGRIPVFVVGSCCKQHNVVSLQMGWEACMHACQLVPEELPHPLASFPTCLATCILPACLASCLLAFWKFGRILVYARMVLPATFYNFCFHVRVPDFQHAQGCLIAFVVDDAPHSTQSALDQSVQTCLCQFERSTSVTPNGR